MHRREFLKSSALSIGALAAPMGLAQSGADYRLEIAPLALEIAPGKTIHTTAYSGQVPGPLLRWPEGKALTIDVINRTNAPEIVHWHGLFTPSLMDGAMEEGSPMIAPGAQQRYSLNPEPAGFRWYHTHTSAGRHLDRATYSGQFGCFYIEPKTHAGDYDQEIFLVLHDWNGYMNGGEDASMDVAYEYSTVNGRMLGHGDPIQVRQGQRVLLRILNASATMAHWVALAGHAMTVVAMDGNPVPNPRPLQAVRLGVAERIDATVTMDRPGVWIFGEASRPVRESGMGIVIEYAGAAGKPQWIEPPLAAWDYSAFARSGASTLQPDVIVPLTFESKFRGHGAFDQWTINGKSFPNTDPIRVETGKRYRLRMINRSSDPHPIHLHRHTFEIASLGGRQMSGVLKDVVMIEGKSTTEIDFTADHPGATLFHCHQQDHMDAGFMALLQYV